MAQPTTKAEFKEFCLRKLGKPVIEINVDPDQVDDRIDEALSYYQDYHFDGTEKTYVKHKIERSWIEIGTTIASAGVYRVGDTVYEVPITLNVSQAAEIENATSSAVITAISEDGTKLYFDKPLTGDFGGYLRVIAGTDTENTYYVTTEYLQSVQGAGIAWPVRGVHQNVYITKQIPVSDSIIGITNVFNPESNVSLGSGIFSAKYQFVLHNLHDMLSGPLAHFSMSMSHLQLLEELLVGAVPLRFNRHQNKVNLDMDWDSLSLGSHIVLEAYAITDPTVYTDVWKDRFLQNYATAKIKYQWGSNLTKFNGMTLPGNVQFNGEQILNDAREEIQRLEEDMVNSYSLPASDMIG